MGSPRFHNIAPGQLLSPGEVEATTGVTVRTLQHYDKIGLLSPGRTGEGVANNRKQYTPADIDKLGVIVILKEYGFTLGQIKEIVNEEEDRIFSVLEAQLENLRQRARQLNDLVLFVKFASMADPGIFNALTCGPEELDDFADVFRGTVRYQRVLDKVESWSGEQRAERLEELRPLIRKYVAVNDGEGFRGIVPVIDELGAWWNERICPLGECGYLGFWAILEDSATLASMVEELGGEWVPASLQMMSFYLWAMRVLTDNAELLHQVATAHDEDALRAVDEGIVLARRLLAVMGAGVAKPEAAVLGVSAAESSDLGGGPPLDRWSLPYVRSMLGYLKIIVDDCELMRYLDPLERVEAKSEELEKARLVMEFVEKVRLPDKVRGKDVPLRSCFAVTPQQDEPPAQTTLNSD